MLMADVTALGDEAQLGVQLHPVLPSTVLAVAAGHAAKLSDGAAGGVLLFLRSQCDSLSSPLVSVQRWEQVALRVAVLSHGMGTNTAAEF